MWILPLLGYVGVVLGFGFLTLAIGMLLSFDCSSFLIAMEGMRVCME
jgi:hypothetical protein